MVAVPALLAYAVVAASGGIGDALSRLRHADLWWLVPALGAECLRHVVFGVQLRWLRGDEPVPSVRLGSLISLVTFGLGFLLPAAPTEGMTMSVVELRRRGMSTRGAGLMLVASQVAQFGALISIFALDRVIVVAAGELRHSNPFTAAAISLVLIGLIALGAWGLSQEPTVRWIVRIVRRLPFLRGKTREEIALEVTLWHQDVGRIMGSAINRFRGIVLAAGAELCSATALWCGLRAVGSPVSFEVAVLAYTIAIFATFVPIPGGIGVVELVVPAMLHHFGVPTASGLAGVLVWRAVSFFLPAIGGMLAYTGLRLSRPTAALDQPVTLALDDDAGPEAAVVM